MKSNLILSSKILNKRYVVRSIIKIVAMLICSIIFLALYFSSNLPKCVSFLENGKIDYKVYLEENDFFVNKFLRKDRQYISALINYIIADFEYNILLDNDNISYKYDYRFEIEASVLDKETKNLIFDKRKELINKKDIISTDGIDIKENVKIDYSYYNSLVKELINTYGIMDNTESSLVARLYVDYEAEIDDTRNDIKNNVVLTMKIPLNEKTVNINLDNDVVSLKEEYFIFTSKEEGAFLLLIAIGFGLCAMYFIFALGKYYLDVNNTSTMFEKKLNKILKNYNSYIQKAEGSLDFSGYKILIVDEFESLLEVRDMLSKPIILIEDNIEGIVRFVITTNNIAYIYQLMK